MSLKSEELEILKDFFYSAHEHPCLFILSRVIAYKKQRFSEPGEMSQLVNSSLCEPTDLGLDPQHPCQKLGMVENTLILVLGRWRQRLPGAYWPGSLNNWAQREVLFQKTGGRMMEQNTWWGPLASTPIHTLRCTHHMSMYMLHIHTSTHARNTRTHTHGRDL